MAAVSAFSRAGLLSTTTAMLSRLVVRIGSLEAVSGKGTETDVTALYGGVRDADFTGRTGRV
jgi:hypothetical protein